MNDEELEAVVARARYRGPTVAEHELVGVEACLRQLGGQLALLSRPHLAARFGLEPSGTLLIGPPGTGKTLLARYLANHLKMPLYQFGADEFGADPETLRAVFRRLATERALLYIDEISILAQKRDEYSPDPEGRRLLVALLTSLDGLADSERTLWVIGACTPDIHLDPALYRSGRLGVVIEFALPSEGQRQDLFRLYLRNVPNSLSESDVSRLAEISNHATGADIHDWISQAASEALAEADVEEPLIEYRHLESVVARRGFVAAERTGREPLWSTAVHEAAHALLALKLFGADCLAKVHVGFGMAPEDLGSFMNGHFEMSDDWLRLHPITSSNWRDHVAVDLAGACAEEVVVGERAPGAGSDIARATSLISQLLELGDEEFGPARKQIESDSGQYGAVGSEAMRSVAWHLVSRRFDECYRTTIGLVREERARIERLARILLDAKHVLTGDEIVLAVDPEVAS